MKTRIHDFAAHPRETAASSPWSVVSGQWSVVRILLLLFCFFLIQNTGRAFETDANHAQSLGLCSGLPSDNVPVFAVRQVSGFLETTYYDIYGASSFSHWDYTAEYGYNKHGIFKTVVTSASAYGTDVSSEGTNSWTQTNLNQNVAGCMAWGLGMSCGSYFAYAGPHGPYANGLCDMTGWAEDFNQFMKTGVQPEPNPVYDPYGTMTWTEGHSGHSFITTKHYNHPLNPEDLGDGYFYEDDVAQVSASYDGALLPTRNHKHGRDNGPCLTNCASCASSHGMPTWGISQPFFNLWVFDTPAFYKTSLGQEIAFMVNYKQRDTRPADDALMPPTGWNHNWYSYIRFDVPVVATGTGGDFLQTTKRGFRIRSGWTISTNYTGWEGILYAPDNSESYFDHTQTADPQRGYTIRPIYGGTNGVAGFKLIHSDGSQDLYTLVIGGIRTCGRTERYGTVFDRLGLTNGMHGVWRLNLADADSPQQDWQDEDDTANYTDPSVQASGGAIEALDIYDDPAAPAEPLEYIAYDALLTARLDPFGNRVSLSYSNSGGAYLLTSLTDYDNKTTQLNYEGGFLTSVQMPYGRTAYFSYTDTNLYSITDAQGMTSSMTYTQADGGLNWRLSSLTTPYGTTSFDYLDDKPWIRVAQPAYFGGYDTNSGSSGEPVYDTNTIPVYVGEAAVNHSITVTYTNGAKELYLSYNCTNAAQIAPSVSIPQAVQNAAGGQLDGGNANGGEASLLRRNFFHWDRRQYPLLSTTIATNMTRADFAIGSMQHFLLDASSDSADQDISSSPSLIRDPAPVWSPLGAISGNITFFSYPGMSSNWQIDGESLDWTSVTTAPDGTPLVKSFVYRDDGSGLLSAINETFSQSDGSAGTRSWSFGYNSTPIDANDQIGLIKTLAAISGPSGVILTLNAPGTTNLADTTVLSWPVVAVADPFYRTNYFFYNTRHQPTGGKYLGGLTTTNLYGSDHFLQKSIAVEIGATNSFTFQDGELAGLATPLGLNLTFTHDLLGRLTGTGFPDGTSISNVFYRLDVTAHRDRLGHWSHAQFDHLDHLTQFTDANNHSTTYSYCSCGALDSITDPATNTTSFQRDLLGNVTNTVNAIGSVTIWRDKLSRPYQVTSTWGLTNTIAHNLQGLVTSVSNPAGLQWQTIFDAIDRPMWVTDDRGVTLTNSYDLLDRLSEQWGPLGRIEHNDYDLRGLSQHFDALWNPTFFVRDPAGRTIAVTNANFEVTQFGLDPLGNLRSLTDGRNHTRRWAYNIYGLQIAETNANGVLVKTNGYNANGLLTSQWTAAKGLHSISRDNLGNVLGISYPSFYFSCTRDVLDRIKTITSSAGIPASESFTYTNFGAFDYALLSETGPWGEVVSHGFNGPNLASTTIGSWTESIGRDNALRPKTFTSPAGTFTYTFNGGGLQPATLAGPGSTTTSFGYNPAGLANQISVQSSSTVRDLHSYRYLANGWVNQIARMGSITNNFIHDPIGQIISAQGFEASGVLRKNENFGYSYDYAHNLAFRTNNAQVQSFNCDALDQLTYASRSGPMTVAGSFTGDIVSMDVNGTNAEVYSDQTFASANGLVVHDGNNLFVTAGTNTAGALALSISTSSYLPSSNSFSFDLNGNMLSDGQRAMEWDDANRLSAISAAHRWREEFGYDAFSRRRIVREYSWNLTLGTWHLTQEVHFVFDGYLPLQERDASGNVLVTYTRGLDLSGTFDGAGGIGGLLARTDGSGSAFYHSDSAGNVTSMTDGSGNVVARYLYSPFGDLLGQWGTLATVNRMRFSSMPYFTSSGLYGYWARFYDPNLQRWLNQDPIGEEGGINLYRFAANDPLNWVDPYGLALHGDAPPSGLLVPGPFGYYRGDNTLENLGAGIINTAPFVGNFMTGTANSLWDGLSTVGNGVHNAIDEAWWRVTGNRADTEFFTRGTEAGLMVLPKIKLPLRRCPARPLVPYSRELHYPNTPTKADRAALGAGPSQVVDHQPELVKRYYDGDPSIGEKPGFQQTSEERAGSAADRNRMGLQSAEDSAAQGGAATQYSKQKKKEFFGH